MSYTENLAVVINALIEQKANELVARREGKPVPGGIGSSLGGTSVSTDGVIDKGENDNNGNDEEKEKLKDKLEPGDEPEKFKLFDCETNEEVTIDGLGGDGVGKGGPSYPTGFEDCKAPKPPSMADLDGKTIYQIFSNNDVLTGIVSNTYHLSLSKFTEGSARAKAYQDGRSTGGCSALNIPSYTETTGSEFWLYQYPAVGGGCITPSSDFATTVGYRSSTSNEFKQGYIDEYEAPKWPAPDKNHLVWSKDKNCMEPLCPDLNNQVAAKYKGCNEEMVLCDEDGNRVKVTIDGDEMKVLQTKFNQEATVKNGKVQSTKPLTPEQVARAMKG